MRKAIIAIASLIAGILAGGVAIGKLKDNSIESARRKSDKFKGYYTMLTQWLILKQQGRSLEEYFLKKGYKTVAIYGLGDMGECLYEELRDSSIVVKYAVDKNANSTYLDLNIIDSNEVFEKVDVMVVTATFAFDEIADELAKKVDFSIVSLDDIVYECVEN